MEEDRATIVLSTAIKAARELGDLIFLLREEDVILRTAIPSVIYDIMQDIVSPILNDLPSLKDAVESRIERYGRAF